jgi:hypothetical protein
MLDVTVPVDSDDAANGVAENAQAGPAVGITALASDGDGSAVVTYSLDDDAGGRFAIDPATGLVTVADGSLLDYEAAASHQVTVRASSSDGSSATQSFTIAVTDTNDTAPVVTSGGAVSIAEGTAGTIYTATATDADTVGGPIAFAISGVDAALFAIDSTTGELSFLAAPDFESPLDADSNNVYELVVTASDGTSTCLPLALAVAVTDVVGVTVTGTDGDDVISPVAAPAGRPFTTGEQDILLGLGGADQLVGGGGNDYLYIDHLDTLMRCRRRLRRPPGRQRFSRHDHRRVGRRCRVGAGRQRRRRDHQLSATRPPWRCRAAAAATYLPAGSAATISTATRATTRSLSRATPSSMPSSTSRPASTGST